MKRRGKQDEMWSRGYVDKAFFECARSFILLHMLQVFGTQCQVLLMSEIQPLLARILFAGWGRAQDSKPSVEY
jgi:hypothetical protein